MATAITGATGFLGKALLREISPQGDVVALVRKKTVEKFEGVEYRICGDLSPTQEWSQRLKSVDKVIHMAGRVHTMHERSALNNKYRRTNVDATLNLARHAVNAGVTRFIFLSSSNCGSHQVTRCISLL